MKLVLKVFAVLYSAVAAVFGITAVALLVLAVLQLVQAAAARGAERVADTIETLGLLAVALVALEMSQTIAEEEVVRKAPVASPTRVRRYLSRFLVVIVVALSIEGLVAAVTLLHSDPSQLPKAASIGFGAAALLAGWGVFIRMNRAAEELEPDALNEVKGEDEKVQ